jgi:hypothetical protein
MQANRVEARDAQYCGHWIALFLGKGVLRLEDSNEVGRHHLGLSEAVA